MTTQVILNPNGSGGDVFPYLAIGRQLQTLGHHVALMTNAMFQEFAGQANLEFIPLGQIEELVSVGSDPALQAKFSAWKLALKWVTSTVPDGVQYLSERRLRCPTMFVGSPLSFAMRIVAEKFSVPMTTLVLSPYLLRSQFCSPVMPPLILNRRMPRALKRAQYWLADRWAIDGQLQNTLGPIRQQFGLKPVKRYLHQWCFSTDLNLGLFPEWFAPGQPDWPDNFQHVGPVDWDPRPLDPKATDQVIRWCSQQAHSPLIVLVGSAGPPSADFYTGLIQTLARIGRGLVILDPDRARLPQSLPTHVQHANYIPLNHLLPHCAAVIHSGSIGATLRSAAAGVPQLVFPRVNDQFDNADRAVKLGIGSRLSMRAIRNSNSDSVAHAIQRLLTDLEVHSNCKRVAALFLKTSTPDIASIETPATIPIESLADNNVFNINRAAQLIHTTFHRSMQKNENHTGRND